MLIGNFEAVYLNFHWLNDSWSREFEPLTLGFELVTRGLERVTRRFELITRVDLNSQLEKLSS